MADREKFTVGEHFLQRRGRSAVPVGTHFVPASGPDWPWRVGSDEFDAAFAAIARAGLDTVRIDLLWAAVEPEPGELDEEHLRVLDAIFDAAGRHGVSLHPTLFVGGEVGDAYWDVPWGSGRNPHADADLVRLQAEHAGRLATRWGDHPALIAWDLTDEPPFWIHRATTTDDDARVWTRALTTAIRSAAPGNLVTIGTASQEVDAGPFRADVVADELDFCCVHPYPIYSPELYPDALLTPRMTHAAAFETALARGAGKPVMVHEFGASSLQFDPDRIAAYDRLSLWSSFGAGAVGYYAWCWTDAADETVTRAPYVRMPHELQFGLVEQDDRPRPRLQVLSELAKTLGDLDLDAVASHGPVGTAAVLVPHEYVHPYDPAAYGLQAPSGHYRPAEAAWEPERDVTPLVRAWISTYLLAAGAGMGVEFPREQLDGSLPDTRLLLAPAPLTTTTSSLLHLRASSWGGVPALHRAGGTLYLSLNADSAIPDLESIAGVRIADRAPMRQLVELRFLEPFGDLVPGDVLQLPACGADLQHRGVLLDPVGAQILAVDESGAPVLTLARRRAGATVTCAHPIELLLAARPDAEGSEEVGRLYAALADLAGARLPAHARDPRLTSGMLRGPAGGVLVVTNHSGGIVETELLLPEGAVDVASVQLSGSSRQPDGRLRIDAHSAAVVVWREV